MLRRALCLALLFVTAAGARAGAQVVRLADLNTTQIRALDRTKTVVFLPGGMLEEHGPYLPAYTDGILSERLTDELARAAVAVHPGLPATAARASSSVKPGWTALVFPQMPAGS